jgi:spectinomycin phosphotransferase
VSGSGIAPLPDQDSLRDALRDAHGLDVVELEKIDEGADAAAIAFRARTADGAAWFVKLRPDPRHAGVLVPRWLRDHGVPEAVASVGPVGGEPWLRVGGWSVLVAPFVAAPSVMRHGMGLDGWRRFGEIAARLHAVRLPADLAGIVPRETFEPRMTAVAREVDRHVGRRRDARGDDPLTRSVRETWRAKRPTLRHLVSRAEDLGTRIRGPTARGERIPFVLCHADLHTANVLVADDGTLSIVDWDELLLAPRERDLMFVRDSVVAGPVSDVQADAFEAGYGSPAVDPLLIAYYRVDWAVQDLAGYAHQVLLEPDRSRADRVVAAERFLGQFGPAGEVPWALAAERTIPAGQGPSGRCTGRTKDSKQP